MRNEYRFWEGLFQGKMTSRELYLLRPAGSDSTNHTSTEVKLQTLKGKGLQHLTAGYRGISEKALSYF